MEEKKKKISLTQLDLSSRKALDDKRLSRILGGGFPFEEEADSSESDLSTSRCESYDKEPPTNYAESTCMI